MRRVLVSSLAILAMSASMSTAALADDAAAPTETKAAKSTPAKSKSSTNLATRIASTVVCGVAGIPVCMVKKSRQEIMIATKDLVGDTDNKWKLAVGAVPLGVSAGLISGFFQGFFYGPYNAWKHSADAPFSAADFSLGDEK